jgi:polysaccharide biosynthesis protein PslE
LKNAKNRMGLASINGQRDTLELRIREIAQNVASCERDLNEVEARLTSLKGNLDKVPERVDSSEVDKPNSVTDVKSTQLYGLQLIEIDFKAKYGAGHPKLIAIRSQVEEAEKELKKQSTNRAESTSDINPIHRDLTLDVLKSSSTREGLIKKLETLKRQESEALKRITDINSYEIEISDLEREARLSEKKYLIYSESLEQARIKKELESNKISSVSIAQDATLQERPISPSKLMVAAFGSIFLLAGGLAIGLLSAQLDDRITTPQAVRNRIGIPMLATIPRSRAMAISKTSK